MAKYFGTNGARGLINELTPEIVQKLAQATGVYLKKGKILVARDGRLTGELYFKAVAAGLLAAGCEIIDLGMVSSPTAEFMAKKLHANGLMIITASHNPPEWNGIKVVDGNGFAVSCERGEEIEKIAETLKINEHKAEGKLTKYETATEEHIAAILQHVNVEKIRKKKPKIVLDCGNGMASLIAPQLFTRLGCEVIPFNSHVDGNFPGRPSEPTEANVQDMLKLVKETKADAGFAWDGDADRLIAADEHGNFIIGDKVFALSVLLKLKEKKGPVVTTVATSLAIEDIAKAAGAKVVYTRIGAPYLCESMKGAVIGGEEVGGVVWPEISLAKEGMLTAAKIVEAICDKPLSLWLKQLPEYKNIKEKIAADDKKKKQIVQQMLDYAQKNKLDFTAIDGVRINYPHSWIIVRASGTENYVRIFAEAKTEQEAKELIKKHRTIIGE
ncbi:MAG: phosphoglucosamine mutase [Candidatus Micrarchaeota archaeon]